MDFLRFVFDFIIHIDLHLAELVADYNTWVYAILFLIIFCETGLVLTPLLPGDSLLFAAGTLAARPDNDLHIWLLIAVLSIAAIAGDTANFEIGKYFGAKLFSKPDSKIFKQEYLTKTHAFYQKHGGKTIILARFVPVVRTFAPFVAGMGRMAYKYFISYNFIGGLAWVSIFLLLGFFVGNFAWVQNNLKFIMLAIIIVSVLPAVIEALKSKFSPNRQPEN